MREYTRYAIQELVQPSEFEKIISEMLFNLSQDATFPERDYPDIRYIGGTKDFGHDAISITWRAESDFSKTIFAFSKRKDWKTKLNEDLNKHKVNSNINLFIFITTEKVGSWKLPEKLLELHKTFKFIIEIIDIEDIVIWLDNTSWGKSIKRKYRIDSDDIFIYLKSYEIALQNDERIEELFRIKGPIEIDFIKELVIRREEVDLIIERLKEDRIHIIVGPPASGKTVLARNICYDLNKLYDIYWLDMEDLIVDQTRVYLEIQRLNRTNSLLIVENGHISIKNLEELIQYIIYNTSIVKMLITARNTNIQESLSRRLARLIGNENYKTEILASDIAKKLILFYSAKFGKNIGEKIDKFLYYKDDLWLLSYLLKAYIDSGKLGHDVLFKKVNDDLIEYNERIGIGASDIILLISWITQNSAVSSGEYGDNSNHIPIDDFFLIDKLGYGPDIVLSLVRLGIIKKVNDGYWCWHTSLSRIYIETAERYPNHFLRINLKFKEILGDFFDADDKLTDNINVFNIYLNIHPEYTDRILNITSQSGLLLFKWQKILNNFDTRDLIYSSLRNGNLEQINSIVHIINIFNFRKDTELIYKELIYELGPDRVKDKISGCRNSREIVGYAYLFYRMSSNIGIKIINSYKDLIIKNFAEMSLEDIGSSLEFIFELNPYFAEEIIRTDCLFEKNLVSGNLFDATSLLQDLTHIREIERRLYPNRGTNWLKACSDFLHGNWTALICMLEKDKDSESISRILSFISCISHIDTSKGIEAGNLAGHSYIISRLNEINGLSELRYTIFSIENIYPELKHLIITEFVKLIENEIKDNGVFSVAYFFGCLFKDSNLLENGKGTMIQIINRMDKDIVKTMSHSSIYPFNQLSELGF